MQQMFVDHRPLTPARATVYGLTAGLAATGLFSLLSRVPDIRRRMTQAAESDGHTHNHRELEVAAPMSPGSILAQAEGPGPEGPAGLFAAKLASGLFGRDLGRQTRMWGRVIHIAYGSLWGAVYAMEQTNVRRSPVAAGTTHGLALWALGPGTLGPAMKLMPPPATIPPQLVALDVASHVAYGLVVAAIFDRLISRPTRDV